MAVQLKGKSASLGTTSGSPGVIKDTPAESTHLNQIVNDLANTRWRLSALNDALNALRSRVLGEGEPTSSSDSSKAAPVLPHVQEINAIQNDIFDHLNSLERHVAGLNTLG